MIVKHCTVESGDWEALYVDGTLLEQGHSVPVWMVFESPLFQAALSLAVKAGWEAFTWAYEKHEYSDDQVEEMGASFPATFKEIPF